MRVIFYLKYIIGSIFLLINFMFAETFKLDRTLNVCNCNNTCVLVVYGNYVKLFRNHVLVGARLFSILYRKKCVFRYNKLVNIIDSNLLFSFVKK